MMKQKYRLYAHYIQSFPAYQVDFDTFFKTNHILNLLQ